MASPNPNQVIKKKRNPPGNPDPDAEVIALSPNTLLATNRFVCEICNKGFQRDQNLQLHRRGHNLPWKLKQRSSKETRKKVYVCPEVTCMHHDPSRALGDLTGIKKHFSRKHGEKKWKCERCCKKYAVYADWKAHNKTCGTREYRCDCGTIFSRRDSFITHRAFCDALAEDNTRAFKDSSSSSTQAFLDMQNPENLNHFNMLPSLYPTPSFLSLPTFHPSPHMSATALLQKAAEMTSIATRDSSANLLGFDPGSQNPNYLQETVASFGEGMTRDFLSMTGFAPCMSSSTSYEQLGYSKKPWTG